MPRLRRAARLHLLRRAAGRGVLEHPHQQDWSEFTPKVSLDWRASDDALLYVSAASGFKGGGWQGKPATEAAALFPYDPEIAWTYEVGAKTDWADGRVRANVAMFHTSFDDLQVEQLDDAGLSLIIDNAASARIDGVELELQVRPVSALQLWLSGSYLDSEYRDFIDSAGNDLSGNRLARTPEFSFAGGVDYNDADHRRPDAGRARRVSMAGRYALAGREHRVRRFVWIAGCARRASESRDGGWEVALFGKNLTDELYRRRCDPVPRRCVLPLRPAAQLRRAVHQIVLM